MIKKFAHCTKLALMVAVVAGTQTGCKSGWKMPGSDMFAWSKKPSESSLAGSNPSLSVPSTGGTASGSGLASSGSPISPAMRNSPNMLASGSKSSPYLAGPSAPSYSVPGQAAPNAFAGIPTNSAAGSNGYTTGPYATNGAGRPMGYTASTGYGAPQGGLAQPSMGNTGLPANGMPPTANGLANAAPYGVPPQTNSYAPPAGVPALPAGMSGTNMAMLPQPGANSSMPNAAPAGYASSQPSMTPAYGGAATYRPGSTARSTGYDFSQGGATASTGLPGATNVPHTANGLPPAPTSTQPTNLYR